VAKVTPGFNSAAQAQHLIKVAVATLFSAGLAWYLTELVSGITNSSTLGVFIQLVTLAISFIIFYYFVARRMQIKELQNLAGLIRR
jgi:hypothetical protein